MDYLSEFINSKLAAGRQQSTINFYRRVLGEFQASLEYWPPKGVCLERFLLKKRSTCNEVTILSVYTAIRTYLNWCERRGYLADNPLKQVEKPKKVRHLPKALPQVTMKKLFSLLTDRAKQGDKYAVRDLAILRLAYDTGCRASELSALRLEVFDIDTSSVMVENGKGQKDRIVYFGKNAATAVSAWLLLHPGGEWLFCSRRRTVIEPLTRRGMLHLVKKWSAELGVQMTFHQIRHSYATHALRRGIDLRHIQNQLGHSDITTTAIYLAVEDEERRRAHQEKSPGDAF